MKCEMIVDESLVEEHPWGWVVVFAPARPEECAQRYPFASYAIARDTGKNFPVGTKGLEDVLQYILPREARGGAGGGT
jgi:hypothetical protein